MSSINRVPCPRSDCWDGWVPCPYCGGSPHPDCCTGGDGSVRCPDCRGTGEIPRFTGRDIVAIVAFMVTMVAVTLYLYVR